MNINIQKNKKYIFLAIVALVVLITSIVLFTESEQKDKEPIQDAISIKIPQENKETLKRTVSNKQVAKPQDVVTPSPPPSPSFSPSFSPSAPSINLSNSDNPFKKAIATLSNNLSIWFSTRNTIRKYTTLVNDISQNQLPYKNRSFLKMSQKMQVNQDANGLYIAKKSYQRYDLLANTIASINTRKALKLYLQFRPLFQQVYNGFSYPKGYRLEDIFMKSAAVVISAPVLDKKIKVVRHATSYRFADKKLEAMGDVEKQMIRMGAKNTKKIQEKLRQFVKAISLLSE